jgi:PAS domain S-box-containing protein
MNEGVIVINQNGLISYVNEKLGEMLEYLPSEIIGHLIWDFVDEANLKVVQEQRIKRRRGESGSYELGLKKRMAKNCLPLPLKHQSWQLMAASRVALG